MPSQALTWWRSDGAATLNEMAAAHAAVGGSARGRRFATGQINNAYAVLLSSQFQKFCRDLHTEAAEILAGSVPHPIQDVVLNQFIDRRKLDVGNPSPGNVGSDFGRFGLVFWDAVVALNRRNAMRRNRLDELCVWRNAIAHQDFTRLPSRRRWTVSLAEVRRWRNACDGLASAFDEVLRDRLHALSAIYPW